MKSKDGRVDNLEKGLMCDWEDEILYSASFQEAEDDFIKLKWILYCFWHGDSERVMVSTPLELRMLVVLTRLSNMKSEALSCIPEDVGSSQSPMMSNVGILQKLEEVGNSLKERQPKASD
ncbi:hypothetical protein L1987_28315 [Smallanthus sonchifolius]|uniref:Uncharacterized protein n=1 Tax=Smallanthus sonchifolius TaxID=185202 RepID=A0ACB9IBS7_9ASTR|nr:hypothetical protein L1987_28315 [Smallanthus sonchifolius]